MIINLSHDLNLRGFCRPGKPGFICVEGSPSSADEFWKRIKGENWQRISLIERTEEWKREQSTLFDSFQELLLGQSEFFKFLQERKCEGIIKDYLGL